LSDYGQAIFHFEKALEENSDIIEILGYLAASYYLDNQLENADEISSQLLKMDHQYQYGAVQYALARLSLVKGNINDTNKLLKEAVSRGIRYRGVTFQNDPFFHSLYDSKGFQNLLHYWK